MGISSAMYSGVSGLNTNSQAMSVIGNNLANTNTIGFKGSRTVFADLLSGSINGSGGQSQVGRGVGMSKVDQVFSQGTFETTESNLDVAIEGSGFFILKEAGDATAYYTRAGSFRFNEDGYLVNPEGLMVQGKAYDSNGTLKTGDAGSIKVASSGLVAGNVTSTLELTTNLDSTEPIIDLSVATGTPFSPIDSTTYNYSSSVQVFDTLGNPHLLSTYFTKTLDNEWEAHWSAEKADGSSVMSGSLGTLDFTSAGVLTGPTSYTIPPGTNPGELSWGNSTTDTGITVNFDTTQFNSESVVISQNQNGSGAGNLTGVAIDSEGRVIASYSNGEQTKIAQLILGKFVNTSGLSLAGSNLYKATTSSGPARTGLPGPELGKVFTNSLEQSNVDMGAEFVKMITVQRGFQANSKIITTVDELLGDLINLKR